MTIRRSWGIVALAAGLALASSAFATHNEPSKAKSIKGEFVTAYDACTAPNTITTFGLAACDPPTRSSPCSFGSKGSGKWKLSVAGNAGPPDTSDLKIAASFSGLEACEGLSIALAAEVRVTADDCSGSACTSNFPPSMPLGASCTVVGGKCIAKGAITSILPGLFSGGKTTGITILGIHADTFGGRAFDAGILVR